MVPVCGPRTHPQYLFLAALCLALTASISAEPLPNIAANQNRNPAGRFEAGVLTLHLELRKGVWRPDTDDNGVTSEQTENPDGIETYAFAEAGHELQIPGPLIRVPQDTELHVTVHNPLAATIFVHGLEQHPGNEKDFVQLAPGETKELRFSSGTPGSYLYWATTSAEIPVDTDGPMAGAFIVDPPNVRADDRVFVIQLWAKDLMHRSFRGQLAINGRSWPATERLQAHLGQPEHWRILNASRALIPCTSMVFISPWMQSATASAGVH